MKSFEMNLAELQKIVSVLENEDLPLERVFELYKQGMQIADIMNKQISEISGKITALEKEAGVFTEKEFTPEAGNEE